MQNPVKLKVFYALLILLCLANWSRVADVMGQTPKRPATPKVQVYIMLGQSNMLGFGRVGPADQMGTLEYFVKEKKKYAELADAKGEWVERKDVRYVHVMDGRGGDHKDMNRFRFVKNEWLKPAGRFGPELGFGSILGEHHEEPVLLIKACGVLPKS